MLKKLTLVGVFFLLATYPLLPKAQATLSEGLILRPLVGVTQRQSADTPHIKGEDLYVKQVGAVEFVADQFFPKSPITGVRSPVSDSYTRRPITLRFFENREFTFVVDTDVRPEPNVMNLRARREGDEISTLILTVTETSYLMTLQDLPNRTVYRVVGDMETGFGKVIEIDLTLMPPRKYSPPIIPPAN
jgi:hypothetical protein